MTDIQVLNPRVVLGLKTDVPGNVDFITDEDIVYPAGGLLSIQNETQRKQKFIKLPDKGYNVNNILLSPNK